MSNATPEVLPAASARGRWQASSVATPAVVSAAVLLVLAVGAFWPMYLSKPFSTIDRYTHAHAAIGLVWMLLLVAQPLLIRQGRRPLHRALGRLAWIVAPGFVVSGVLLSHVRFAAMDAATLAREAYFLFLPLGVATLFALAAALALVYRRTAALHARFMIATGLLLIDPVVVRLLVFYLPPLPGQTTYQWFTFGLTDLAYLALVLLFQPRPRDERPLWAFLAVMVAVQALWFALAPTAAWHAFAQWFRSLPLS